MSTVNQVTKTTLSAGTAAAAPSYNLQRGRFNLPLRFTRKSPSGQAGEHHRRSWPGGKRTAETGIQKAGQDGAVVKSITPGPIIGSEDKGKRDYTIILEKNPNVEFVKQLRIRSQDTFYINTWRNAVRDGRRTCPLLYRKGKFVLGDWPEQDYVTTPSAPVVRSRQGSMNVQQNGQNQSTSSSRRSSMK